MTTMVPYRRYSRPLAQMFPFDVFDEMLPALNSNDAALGFKMDVEDAGDTYLITAELPGVTRDQIDVELNEGRLSISVEKTESEENKSKNFLHKEIGSWSATRGIYLKDASTEGLNAKLSEGILTVQVPKQDEKANVTKIAID